MKEAVLILFLVALIAAEDYLFRKPFHTGLHHITAKDHEVRVDVDVTVALPLGNVTGMTVDLGNDKTTPFYGKADVFLGIPFAQPPIGSLRFKYPVNITKFTSNPFIAKRQPQLCPQAVNATTGQLDQYQSEDCLYLNIITPKASSDAKYPVMVFIHGGSFIGGGAMEFGYEGIITNLVNRGIVVVLIQYRLGALGFFTTFTNEIPVNRAMFDQLMALQFINKNINYFGGDNTKITLAGQSAGSASASAHSYSPLSRNLFQQVILFSGTLYIELEGALGNMNLDFARANKICGTSEEEWNSKPMDGVNECMMKANASEMVALEFDNKNGWQLRVDSSFNNFLPVSPQKLIETRLKLPIMLGTMRNEYTAFLIAFNEAGLLTASTFDEHSFDKFLEMMISFFGDKMGTMREMCLNVYEPYNTSSSDNLAWLKIADAILTSASFASLTGSEAQRLFDNGFEEVYLYENSYAPSFAQKLNIKGWDEFKPAMHSDDLVLLMRTLDMFGPGKPYTDTDMKVSNQWGMIVTDFVKGASNLPTKYNWKSVDSFNNMKHYAINSDGSTGMSPNPYRSIDMLLWTKVANVVMGDWPMGDYTSPDFRNRKDSAASTSLNFFLILTSFAALFLIQ
uniref:Carboxylic ester hydrolase n=1 Tax=Rhabditophanes sp. KR3021 TaxID=114890 RepID=A0AC35U276_9BILA